MAIGSQLEAVNGTITLYSISPDVDRLTNVDSRSGATLPTVTRLSSTSRAHILNNAAASFSEKGLDAEKYITAEPHSARISCCFRRKSGHITKLKVGLGDK